MANISGSTIIDNDHQVTATWTLGNADTGIASNISRWADRTVHVTGTFGGATVTIQGSNDNTNWVTLNDTNGAALTFTAAGMKIMAENPSYTRAITSGGAGTTVVVTIRGAGGQ